MDESHFFISHLIVYMYESYCDLSIFQAIEFAMEEGDDELWDILIRLSIVNPSKHTNNNTYECTYVHALVLEKLP